MRRRSTSADHAQSPRQSAGETARSAQERYAWPVPGGANRTDAAEVTAHQDEAQRAGLGITFTAVLPRITPLTDLGRPAVRAYAARSGQSEEEYLRPMGKPLTPEAAGAALVELVRADAATEAREYLLTGAGLQKLPA